MHFCRAYAFFCSSLGLWLWWLLLVWLWWSSHKGDEAAAPRTPRGEGAGQDTDCPTLSRLTEVLQLEHQPCWPTQGKQNPSDFQNTNSWMQMTLQNLKKKKKKSQPNKLLLCYSLPILMLSPCSSGARPSALYRQWTRKAARGCFWDAPFGRKWGNPHQRWPASGTKKWLLSADTFQKTTPGSFCRTSSVFGHQTFFHLLCQGNVSTAQVRTWEVVSACVFVYLFFNWADVSSIVI